MNIFASKVSFICEMSEPFSQCWAG